MVCAAFFISVRQQNSEHGGIELIIGIMPLALASSHIAMMFSMTCSGSTYKSLCATSLVPAMMTTALGCKAMTSAVKRTSI